MNPNSVNLASPFDSLFPVRQKTLDGIKASMALTGFDKAEPLVLGDWGGGAILVDGHMRLRAAIEVGVDDVPVVERSFVDEDEALKYAIKRQRDRRNLTDAELANCVKELDKRKRQGERTDLAPSKAKSVPGKSAETTADLLGTSRQKVEKVRTILEHGDEQTKEDVFSGEKSINKGYEEAVQRKSVVPIPPKKEPHKVVMNLTNDNIEWAKWTWNPVTGCKHGCDYCYARDIAMRFDGTFEPRFRDNRLDAPINTKVPEKAATDIGFRNVFVCSMADLFGGWVPADWVESVLDVCAKTPQWNYLFLTKNPHRLTEFTFPKNAWVGTTIDKQSRVASAVEAFEQINATVKFVSCEPMLEKIDIPKIEVFDWIIIGGKSKTRDSSEFQPKWEWVWALTNAAKMNGLKVYWKPNLRVRPREYPVD